MKYYRILILAALPIELTPLKESFNNLSIPWVSFSFLLTGVGNYNSIFEVQKYLDSHQDIDFLLNVWVCGKKWADISSDMFQVYRIKHLHSQKESLCPIYINTWNLKSIWCSEKVATDSDSLGEERYVDMESYGIDFVAKKKKKPYLLLKFPLDVVSVESKKIDTQEIVTLLGGYDYQTIVTQILAWCRANISEQPLWGKYKKQFWFTVSESEIFKKQYNKLIAFWKDPVTFLQEHSQLWKKQLLQQMIAVDDTQR